jgi:hypothetical protein
LNKEALSEKIEIYYVLDLKIMDYRLPCNEAAARCVKISGNFQNN